MSDYDRHMAEMDRLNPPLVRGEDYHEALVRAMLAVEDERDALAERVAELTRERDALVRGDGEKWERIVELMAERDAIRGEVAELTALLDAASSGAEILRQESQRHRAMLWAIAGCAANLLEESDTEIARREAVLSGGSSVGADEQP